MLGEHGVVGTGFVRSVLILDDDERVAGSLARSLGADRVVYTATDALTAFDIARKRRPDLVVVDLRLGATSGLDVIRQLKSEFPATTVVLISGYLSIDITVNAVKAGADAVVSKPITGRELLRRVAGVPVEAETPSLDQVEAEHIARVLTDCDGNISEAARRLGIYRSTLQRKLRKHDSRNLVR